MHRRSILAAAIAVTSGSACGSDSPVELAPSGSAPAPPPPLPRPAELIGTATLRSAQRVHDLLRETYGLSILPGARWEASAVVLAGLPITATETIDDRGSVRFALVEPAGEPIGVVAALPLRAPDKLIATVTAGEAAGHRVKRDDAGIDWLTPVRPEAHPGRVLAVARNHLVVGSSERVVALAAAFLANPAALEIAAGEADLEVQLPGAGAARLAPALAPLRRVIGPDPTMLEDLIPIGDLAAALASAEQLTLALSIEGEALRLDASLLRPAAEPEPPASCPEGPLGELLEASADATVTIAMFAAADARKQSAIAAAGWIERAKLIDAGRQQAIASALVALAAARGAALRLSLEKSPRGWLAYGSSLVDDAAGADGALNGLNEALAAGEARAGMHLSMEATVIERIGDVRRVRIRERETDAGTERTLATVLLRRQGSRLALATGADPAYALRKALGPAGDADEPAFSLDGLPSVRALLFAVDERANAFFAIDPAALLAVPRQVADGARSVWVGSLKTCGKSWSLRSALQCSGGASAAGRYYGVRWIRASTYALKPSL